MNFHGEPRRNDTHASTTDPEAKLARKGDGKEAKHPASATPEQPAGYNCGRGVRKDVVHAKCACPRGKFSSRNAEDEAVCVPRSCAVAAISSVTATHYARGPVQDLPFEHHVTGVNAQQHFTPSQVLPEGAELVAPDLRHGEVFLQRRPARRNLTSWSRLRQAMGFCMPTRLDTSDPDAEIRLMGSDARDSGDDATADALMTADAPPARAPLPLDEWLRPALRLPLFELTLDVTLRSPVRVSSPICAVVRGLLGQRLRDLRCLTGAPRCDGCPRTADCDYARIFDSQDIHPFWFRGLPATDHAAPGTRCTVTLYLAAPAQPPAPYVDVALRDALRLLAPDAVLAPTRWRRLDLGDLLPAAPPPGSLRLRTATPWLLRGDEDAYRRRCPQVPWFSLLVGAGVRRIDALVRRFAAPTEDRVSRAVLPELTDVALVAGRMSPWSSSRFSHRQRRRMPLRGLHGDVTLDGSQLAATVLLLRVLAVTGVGKSTSLGLGAFDLIDPPG